MSVEDMESNEKLVGEKKEELDEKEKEELSADESPAKMEIDPTESPSDKERSMAGCDLASNPNVFYCMCKISI